MESLIYLFSKYPSTQRFNRTPFVKEPKKTFKILRIIEKSKNYFYKKNELQVINDDDEIFLRLNGSDINVYHQVVLNREYQTVIDTVKLNKINVRTIIDLGSNIGLTTLFFLKYFPDAMVIALEPDTDNFKQLCKNTEKLPNNIIKMQKAIWSENTKVYLHDDFRDKQDWAKRVLTKPTSNEIEAITLDSIITENGVETIDILKIDIEGGEAEIFKIGSDLSFLKKTKIIAIEIHDEFNCRDQINKILIDNEFVLYQSGETTVGINLKYL